MTEHDEQEAIFKLAAHYAGRYPMLDNIAAVPNGGLRERVVAYRMKQEGMRAGVPDLFLAWPGTLEGVAYPMLWIELKTPRGVVSEAQLLWHQRLRAAGHAVRVCRGWAAAWHTICAYLSLPDETHSQM